jgi:hypothetical protein
MTRANPLGETLLEFGATRAVGQNRSLKHLCCEPFLGCAQHRATEWNVSGGAQDNPQTR